MPQPFASMFYFPRHLELPNAYHVDGNLFGGPIGCPERVRERRSALHLQSQTGAPTRRRARSQKFPYASRFSCDLGDMEGPDAAYHVDVDFIAAGEEETYSYICVITQGSAFVRRTMN